MNGLFSWQHAIIKSHLEPTTRHVCLTIGCHMAADGSGCFPSYQTIADESGLSRRSVIEHVGKAAAAGYLTVDARQRENGSASSNIYRPTMPTGGERPALGGEPAALGGSEPGSPLLTDHLSNRPSNTPPVAPQGATVVLSGDFEDFWQAYPNKVGKPVAIKAFLKAKPDMAALMDGLAKWKASPGWQKDRGRFIPHPTTFLNQRRWEDMPVEQSLPQSESEKRNQEFWANFDNQQKQIA